MNELYLYKVKKDHIDIFFKYLETNEHVIDRYYRYIDKYDYYYVFFNYSKNHWTTCSEHSLHTYFDKIPKIINWNGRSIKIKKILK